MLEPENGKGYALRNENKYHFQNTIRIYIKAYQEEAVGNGSLFPDLEIAVNNIRNAFNGKKPNL